MSEATTDRGGQVRVPGADRRCDVAPVGVVRAAFGEGPTWDAAHNVVRWVDIPAGDVHATDPLTGNTRTTQFTPPVSAVVPTSGGRFAAAAGRSLLLVGTASSDTRALARLPLTDGYRMNDAVCDGDGRLWVGTMPPRTAPQGSGRLWRIDGGGQATVMLDGLRLPNGLGWSPDGRRLYLVDTLVGSVDVFDLDGDRLTGRQTLVRVDAHHGRPDGLAVDENGAVWVALAGGGALHRYSPVDGRLLRRVELPVSHPTSCSFGGSQLAELYVTTAGPDHGDRTNHPYAGHLLRLDVGIAGLPSTPMGAP